MSIGKTGHVLVRTSHSRGQLKGQRFQSSKSAMSGGLNLVRMRFHNHDRFCAGTGTPGIFTLTVPRTVRLTKYSVFQSSPPKPMLLVAG